MTNQFYETYARDYAARTCELSDFPGLEDELALFAKHLPAGGIVLDLGSGSGRDSRYFRDRGFRVVLIDRANALLREARSRVGEPLAIYLVADMRALPLRGRSMDGIWASGSMLHLDREEMHLAMTEVSRVLRPSGTLGLSMKLGAGAEVRLDGRLFTYVSLDELHELANSTGFRVVKTIGPSRKSWVTLILTLEGDAN